MDALKYFDVYHFALRMDIDSVQTALATPRFFEAGWTKTAFEDGFVSYGFQNEKICDFKEEVVPAG